MLMELNKILILTEKKSANQGRSLHLIIMEVTNSHYTER